ncbi:hypothetical protein [Anaerobacillus alkaliphilus]|nr:hypothetical protein [Anaerobacillus alkaliphilus]
MEIEKQRFCPNCKKETKHKVREDALEIEYRCLECQFEEEVIKTFF